MDRPSPMPAPQAQRDSSSKTQAENALPEGSGDGRLTRRHSPHLEHGLLERCEGRAGDCQTKPQRQVICHFDLPLWRRLTSSAEQDLC